MRVVMLDPVNLAALVLFVAVAAYLQTLTGFAFALVFMGAVAVTGAVGIEEGAIIATLLALVNAALILASERRFVAMATFLRIVPPALLGTVAGAWLLPVLVAASVVWLKLGLGLVIIVSSLRLLRLPGEVDGRRNAVMFPLSGLVGGVMGGLFAIPGPPIVHALQRGCADQRTIRATLVAIFAAISAIRLAAVSVPALPAPGLLLSALALVPATIAATEAARRWPPPLSPQAARGLTVALLVLSGVALALPALTQAG